MGQFADCTHQNTASLMLIAITSKKYSYKLELSEAKMSARVMV